MGSWTQELTLRRIAAQWSTSGGAVSLIQSVKLNGHDPYAYLKDVLVRLPTQRASEIAGLLLHKAAAE